MNSPVCKAVGLLFLTFIGGCQQAVNTKPEGADIPPVRVLDFEQALDLSQLKLMNSISSRIKTENGYAAKVEFLGADHHQSSVIFTAKDKWDWSNKGSFGVALDITNPEATSVHFYVSVRDKSGASHNRSVVVPAQSAKQYVIELKGRDLDIETGIRSNPFSWNEDYVPIIWRHGSKNIDLTEVSGIEFKVVGVPDNKVVLFDNIKLVKPTSINPEYLAGLVDQFGQSTRVDFNNKVHTTQELMALSKLEQSALANPTALTAVSLMDGNPGLDWTRAVIFE